MTKILFCLFAQVSLLPGSASDTILATSATSVVEEKHAAYLDLETNLTSVEKQADLVSKSSYVSEIRVEIDSYGSETHCVAVDHAGNNVGVHIVIILLEINCLTSSIYALCIMVILRNT